MEAVHDIQLQPSSVSQEHGTHLITMHSTAPMKLLVILHSSLVRYV